MLLGKGEEKKGLLDGVKEQGGREEERPQQSACIATAGRALIVRVE